MKEKNKKKFHFRLPKRSPLTLLLLILIPILLFFIIAIPTLYITNYNENKVTPFASDIEGLNKDDIVYGNKSAIPDFNLVVYCKSYNNETGKIDFRAFAYENENTSKVIDLSSQIQMRFGMYSNWIKLEKTYPTSSFTSKYIAPSAKEANRTSRYYLDFSLSGIPTTPAKGSLPFISVDEIPLYGFITYSTTINGTKTTQRYILKFEYKDYIIPAITLEDNREQLVRVDSANNIQWQRKGDLSSSWTTLISANSIETIETRVDGSYIQWKQLQDSVWTNLQDIKTLSNYEEGKVVETRISGSYIQWKYSTDTSWNNLVQSSNANTVVLQTVGNRIQWKRRIQPETEWKDLKTLTDNTADKKIETRISSSQVQYRYEGDTTWNTIVSVNSLIGFEAQINAAGVYQWKCADYTDWKDLVVNGEIVTTSNVDKNPQVIGPTM